MPASAAMNIFSRHLIIFRRLRGLNFVPPFARNHRRRTPNADGEVATIVAPANHYHMSSREGKMAASESSVHSDQRVSLWMALAIERSARQVVRGCGKHWFFELLKRHLFGWRNLIARRPLAQILEAGYNGAHWWRHHQAAPPPCPFLQPDWVAWSPRRDF